MDAEMIRTKVDRDPNPICANCGHHSNSHMNGRTYCSKEYYNCDCPAMRVAKTILGDRGTYIVSLDMTSLDGDLIIEPDNTDAVRLSKKEVAEMVQFCFDSGLVRTDDKRVIYTLECKWDTNSEILQVSDSFETLSDMVKGREGLERGPAWQHHNSHGECWVVSVPYHRGALKSYVISKMTVSR